MSQNWFSLKRRAGGCEVSFNQVWEIGFSNSACIARPNSKRFAPATCWHTAFDALEVGVLFGFTAGGRAACPESSMWSPGVAGALPVVFHLNLLGFDLFECHFWKVLVEVFENGLHFGCSAGSVGKHGSVIEDSAGADFKLDLVLLVFGKKLLRVWWREWVLASL